MQVAKWGNSLAVRLPRAVVKALKLKPGDEIEITVSGARRFDVARDRAVERALASIRKFRGRMPAGFRFDRVATNERR
jgi:antitoxin MazE